MYLVCKGGYSGSQTGFYLKDTSSAQVSLLLEDELFLDEYSYLFVNGITGFKVKEHIQSGTCTLTIQYIDYSGEFEEYESIYERLLQEGKKMKQRLTKKPDFNKLPLEEQYCMLHEAELRVQRLERIAEGSIFWRDGTDFQKEVVAEYKEYCDESL